MLANGNFLAWSEKIYRLDNDDLLGLTVEAHILVQQMHNYAGSKGCSKLKRYVQTFIRYTITSTSTIL